MFLIVTDNKNAPSCQNVKNDRFVSIRRVFQALEYAKTRFLLVSAPDPAGGAYDAPPPDSLVGWRGGHSLRIPFPPRRLWHLSASVVWPPIGLKFVHLALW